MTFYVGFVVIFAAVYIFNWTIFIAIMVSLMKKQCQSHHAAETKGENIKKQLRAAITISFLFGLGWGFGFGATQGLQVEELRFIFALVFTTFTGFQGFFIFVLYCVLSERVRKVWKRWFRCLKEQKHSTLLSASRPPKKGNIFTLTSSNPILPTDPQYMFADFIYQLSTFEIDEGIPILASEVGESHQLTNPPEEKKLQAPSQNNPRSLRSTSADMYLPFTSESSESMLTDKKPGECPTFTNSFISFKHAGDDQDEKLDAHLEWDDSDFSPSSGSMDLSLQGSAASDSVPMLES